MKPAPAAPATIDAYIAGFPPEVRARLDSIRQAVRRIAPEATEKISYRIPTFALSGNLVHFAAFAHHIGFYPGSAAIIAFADELAGYRTSKGTIQFPANAPIPLALVERIVAFRVQESLRAKRRQSD